MYLALAKNTKRIDIVDLELKKELSKIMYLFLLREFLHLNNCFL